MWTCSKCGEAIDPQFEDCWNCGTSNTGIENPGFISETATEVGTDVSGDRSPPQFTLWNLLALMTAASIGFALLRLMSLYPPLLYPILILFGFVVFLTVWAPHVAR